MSIIQNTPFLDCNVAVELQEVAGLVEWVAEFLLAADRGAAAEALVEEVLVEEALVAAGNLNSD